MEIFFEKSYMTFHNVFTAFYIREVHHNGIVRATISDTWQTWQRLKPSGVSIVSFTGGLKYLAELPFGTRSKSLPLEYCNL